jgi:2-polyprenyl-6-methoxyphenol hydroxylase-like FAD-dependent oxidoreductase
LQGWLEDHAARLPSVRVLRRRQVTAVTSGGPDRSATARTAQGDAFAADLVVGADGARSTVRATVDPHHDARYAGVLLWRTLVDEQAMPPNVTLPRAGEPAREVYAGPYRLVTYPVPAASRKQRPTWPARPDVMPQRANHTEHDTNGRTRR